MSEKMAPNEIGTHVYTNQKQWHIYFKRKWTYLAMHFLKRENVSFISSVPQETEFSCSNRNEAYKIWRN